MEMTECIKHIIDGNAVIIMGSGASYGAKNPFGYFPSGTDLSAKLYKKCGITPDNEADLQDAAQSFEERFGANELILEIRSELTCSSFSESHEVIFSLPWMRYYTTNYDEVAIFAARKRGVKITPVTLNSDIKDNIETKRICVYINGYIGNLREDTLHSEFKLTANSYQSETNIMNSKWGALLMNDLETAKCVILLGISLNYDLDLSRIIFNANIKEKTLIVSSPTTSDNAKNKLKRYGNVEAIGIDKFAEIIEEINTKYTAHTLMPSDMMYTAFVLEHKNRFTYAAPTAEDIFRLFINGEYGSSLFSIKDEKYNGFISRISSTPSMLSAVRNGKKIVFIHADMGNGKTACLRELRFKMSTDDIYIFTLCNPESSKLSEEINAIASLSKTCKVVIIIDDYTNYMEILKRFSLLDNDKMQYVLTARSAINYNKMPNVLSMFSVDYNSSSVFDINKLSTEELNQCIDIFDRYGLFGRISRFSTKNKLKYLRARNHGDGKFQTIILDLIKSGIMNKKVSDLIGLLKSEPNNYHNAILLLFLIKIMNLRLSTSDIERIMGFDVTTDAQFRADPCITELISYKNNGDFIIKSPITAQYILQKVAEAESVIKTLCLVAEYAIKYKELTKYNNVLTSIISYSLINSFLRGFKRPAYFLSTYYDELSKIEYYRNLNFFWLQYAISCIEIKSYDQAQKYLDTAYGLIPKDFVPFQINNQQARLYLERILHSKSLDPVDDFSSAHKLLMLPITSKKDDEDNVIKLFGYYTKKQIRNAMANAMALDSYKEACKDAYERTNNYLKKVSGWNHDYNTLKNDLLRSYVD